VENIFLPIKAIIIVSFIFIFNKLYIIWCLLLIIVKTKCSIIKNLVLFSQVILWLIIIILIDWNKLNV